MGLGAQTRGRGSRPSRSRRAPRVRRALRAHAPAPAEGRREFVAARHFAGRRAGYYFGTEPRYGTGYFIDYVQMQELLSLDVGDKCEARYRGFARYFNAVVLAVHDDDCTYDVRYEHGATETGVLAEYCRPKSWAGAAAEKPMTARLMAANPAMEEKDESVKWYEQLVAWEKAQLDDLWTARRPRAARAGRAAARELRRAAGTGPPTRADAARAPPRAPRRARRPSTSPRPPRPRLARGRRAARARGGGAPASARRRHAVRSRRRGARSRTLARARAHR